MEEFNPVQSLLQLQSTTFLLLFPISSNILSATSSPSSPMFFRKQQPPASSPPWTTKSESFSKTKDTCNHSINYSNFINSSQLRCILFVCVFLASWLFLLLFWFPTSNTTQKPAPPTCNGSGSFYVYNLPQRFNLGLLTHCHKLNIYTNMCPHVANHGLGQPLATPGPATSPSGSGGGGNGSWFATNQFIAEMIFHARLENHPCRTWDPSKALLFYVPFYGGLHASSMFRESNHTIRDALAVDLVDYIQGQPWWKKRNGKDHFLALGRTAWDFMRTPSGPDFGANTLLNLPPVKNMSVLTVERHPWAGSNQYGVPYPSYFHPTTDTEMVTWQNQMRESKRPYLFSFVGGKRKGLEKAKIRNEIVQQCGGSSRCELVQCGSGASKCHEPMVVLDVMTKSSFCLQAPGDSFTRRSTFDSVLAGCVPVFFSPHTAYTQYRWYLPEEKERYSVFIDEKECGDGKKRIEEVLLEIPSEEVKRMREVVIDMIPRLTYVHPNASDAGFKDAIDVALQELSALVEAKISEI